MIIIRIAILWVPLWDVFVVLAIPELDCQTGHNDVFMPRVRNCEYNSPYLKLLHALYIHY